jgi:hypothetical protein
MEHVVQVERSSLQMLRMKESMKTLQAELAESLEEQAAQRTAVKAVEALLDAIQLEMIRANETDEPELFTALVHDQPQVVEIEELKTRVSDDI